MGIPSARIFGVGAAAMAAISSCGGTTIVSPTPSVPVNSVHLSAQGANYVGAESRLLAGFAIGVGKSAITPGSRVALADSDNGVKAAGEVWSGKSLQTAAGFALDYSATYTTQKAGKHLHGSGHLLVVSTGSVPSLTAAVRTTSGGGLLLRAELPAGPPLDVATSAESVFNIGSDTGGKVVFNGNQFTYTDAQGKVAGAHMFDAGDDVAGNVSRVLNANVPPPSPSLVKLACQDGAISVANSQVFSLSVDDESQSSTSGHHLSIIFIHVIKNVMVDCKTNQVTTSTMLDASGQIDGKSFLALSASPPAAVTSAPDNTPAPTKPPLVSYAPDPSDATALPLPLSPDGHAPTLDGQYTGTFSGSQGRTDGVSSPVSGAVSISVSGQAITITAPGSGTGTVDFGGGASFSFTISADQAAGGTGGTCQFVGFFTNTGSAKNASGKMNCTGPGDSLSAAWTATAP